MTLKLICYTIKILLSHFHTPNIMLKKTNFDWLIYMSVRQELDSEMVNETHKEVQTFCCESENLALSGLDDVNFWVGLQKYAIPSALY